MMISNQLRNKAFSIIIFFSSIFCCFAQTDSLGISCIPDTNYIELLKETGISSKKISTSNLDCKVIESYNSDSLLIRHYYAKGIYFEGILSKGHKIGVWKGYYKGRIIVKIGYIGEQKNRPIYVELWNKKGKHIRKTFLSIIE